jgi:coproporphyrinogen III oxidase
MTETEFDTRKAEAATWFRGLRDRIVAAFEGLEDEAGGTAPAGRFEVSETRREGGAGGTDGGGGLMSVMRGGRVFE